MEEEKNMEEEEDMENVSMLRQQMGGPNTAPVRL